MNAREGMQRRSAGRLTARLFLTGALLALLAGGCSLPLGVWLCDISEEVPPPLPVRGANLVGFDSSEYLGSDAPVSEAVQSFQGIGGNWMAINVWWFQDTVGAGVITPDSDAYTISDEAVAAAITAAHTAGLRVLLRPVVDVRDGAWRARIRPTPGWFESYTAFIQHFASIAAEQQTAALSIGVELSATQACDSQWRELISGVRQTYNGQLVYCANDDAVAEVSWWDAVDIIGVDAWYAVAPIADADVRLMACGWSYWLDRLDQQLASRRPEQPVWLTELGALAAWGSARSPYCYSGNCQGVDLQRVDYHEQATYYRAALLATGARPWLQGVFWWCWYADPQAGYIRPQDYSPQGKPAQDVLRDFWISAAE